MNIRPALFFIALVTLASTAPAWAAGPPLSDYVIYGENGVIIGHDSDITGLGGARNNNAETGVALLMKSGSAIDNFRSGGDVSLNTNAEITNTLIRAPGTSVTLASGAVIGVDTVADPQLPVFPGAVTSFTCPTGKPAQTVGNGKALTLTPGSYGALTLGGGVTLTLNGAGKYFFDSINTGLGTQIIAVPGVKVFVCGNAVFGSAVVLPVTLTSGDITFEVHGTDLDNAFRASGPSAWIGNVFAPFGGIHIGTSGAPSTFVAHLHGVLVRIQHHVTGHNGQGPCCQPPPILPPKESTILHGAQNENNGATLSLRVRHLTAILVGFDVRTVPKHVTKAILRLTVCFTPLDPTFCPDPSTGWGKGGTIDAFRLDDGFERWVEGNGNNFPIKNNPHGTGSGVTWNCVIDTDISNVARDCVGADLWDNGGQSVQGPPRPSLSLITNNMPNGATVDFDVTADVNAGLGPLDKTFMSWFVRGDNFVSFYSREGAAKVGVPGLAPQLLITP